MCARVCVIICLKELYNLHVKQGLAIIIIKIARVRDNTAAWIDTVRTHLA